ncbi:MAG: hydrogenase iron-sulfur subunit [Deltaproteobacteria bacterium]|nr:hydrogenase iron-sulfur subunit [Deltaproteobacteria bacterium]
MTFTPRIVAFLCDHCAYAAADAAGRERLVYPQALLTIRVMCTGRIEPTHVVQALREGADGVLVAGCHPGDCHYLRGNIEALARFTLLQRTLADLGFEPARVRMTWASATESEHFASTVREMTAALQQLGPLSYARSTLEEAPSAVPAHVQPGPAAAAPPAGRRPRLAFYWNASCGGCEEAIVDLAEGLHAVLEVADVVLWPVALDFRRKDIEALPDGDIDVSFINGAVRTQEQVEMAELLRRKSRVVVAFGACAHLGGIVGLGNLVGSAAIRAVSHGDHPGTQHDALHLPDLCARVRPLAEVVAVDCTVPGCPPTTEVILPAVQALLAGKLPPFGAVLSPGRALCETCTRRESRPEKVDLSRMRRIATYQPNPDKCFLADGLVCLGPATRQGCGESCMNANMPCRGCFGPPDGVTDQGAAFLGAVGSLLAGESAEGAAAAAGAFVDPTGTFYRYSMASALIPARRFPVLP